MKYLLAALLLMFAPIPVLAQERDLPAVPRDVRERIRDMRSDARAHRLTGPTTIAADARIESDVLVDGELTLAGAIHGDLIVLGGDLLLRPDASVTGDVLVVGGAIEGAEAANVGGTMLTYGRVERQDRRYEDDDDDDWVHHDDHRRHRPWRRDRDHDGGIDLGLSIAGNYNRVEGLPVMFGPVIRTAGPNRLSISGQAIWRTEPSESLEDEVGYRVRAEQALFGGVFRLGGEFSSMVRAIETRGLNSTEAGLAAALFHSDLHDYYDEQSWAAHAELRPAAFPVSARLVYRDAEHTTLEAADPWSLFRGDDAWRPQPIVANGDLRTLTLSLNVDTRDDEVEPHRGFFGALQVERALDQDLAMPATDLGGTVIQGMRFEDFTSAMLDLRTYLPVNRHSTLNLRGVAAGSVDDAVLPPQFQRAFGGIGTMPGFALFSGACGSRDVRVHLVTEIDPVEGNTLSAEAMRPAYGCDRVLFGQLEYRGGFDVVERWDDEEGRHWHHVDLSAEWAFFVDVARGWAYGGMPFVERIDTETMADVGFGVLFDQAGVYVAMPVTGDDRSLRAVVRLQRRF